MAPRYIPEPPELVEISELHAPNDGGRFGHHGDLRGTRCLATSASGETEVIISRELRSSGEISWWLGPEERKEPSCKWVADSLPSHPQPCRAEAKTSPRARSLDLRASREARKQGKRWRAARRDSAAGAIYNLGRLFSTFDPNYRFYGRTSNSAAVVSFLFVIKVFYELIDG